MYRPPYVDDFIFYCCRSNTLLMKLLQNMLMMLQQTSMMKLQQMLLVMLQQTSLMKLQQMLQQIDAAND